MTDGEWGADPPHIVWTLERHHGDNSSLSPERHWCDFQAGENRRHPRNQTPAFYAARTKSCPQSTAPITAISLIHHLEVGKAAL
jgi:hypothetical protein